jgi:multidrug efflux pump subunit AcrA (membrane-fusion protein)
MDLEKVPVWVWGAGAVVVVLALLQRNSSASQPTVTNVGPADNPYAEANLQARVAGFDKLVGFAGDVVDQGTALAQIDASRTTTLATISAQTAQAKDATAASVRTAEINADTERQRIAAAAKATAQQSSDALAANRSNNKTSTLGTIVNGVTGLVKGIGKIFGF